MCTHRDTVTRHTDGDHGQRCTPSLLNEMVTDEEADPVLLQSTGQTIKFHDLVDNILYVS
jgi:hypothetical protein